MFEIKFRKEKMVGIVVYQVAKLRMLQFYYDFLDYFIDRKGFRTHPDGHGQYVFGVLMQNARRSGPTGASRKVRSDKKELVRNNRPEPRF